MQRPSPERADLLRAFMENRFSSNQDSKAQGASTKREKYFSAEVLRIMEQVRHTDAKDQKVHCIFDHPCDGSMRLIHAEIPQKSSCVFCADRFIFSVDS